jgi:hypothetical protein
MPTLACTVNCARPTSRATASQAASGSASAGRPSQSGTAAERSGREAERSGATSVTSARWAVASLSVVRMGSLVSAQQRGALRPARQLTFCFPTFHLLFPDSLPLLRFTAIGDFTPGR